MHMHTSGINPAMQSYGSAQAAAENAAALRRATELNSAGARLIASSLDPEIDSLADPETLALLGTWDRKKSKPRQQGQQKNYPASRQDQQNNPDIKRGPSVSFWA
jgi:hypothetical protein